MNSNQNNGATLIGLIVAVLIIGAIFVFPLDIAKGFFHLIGSGQDLHQALTGHRL